MPLVTMPVIKVEVRSSKGLILGNDEVLELIALTTTGASIGRKKALGINANAIIGLKGAGRTEVPAARLPRELLVEAVELLFG